MLGELTRPQIEDLLHTEVIARIGASAIAGSTWCR